MAHSSRVENSLGFRTLSTNEVYTAWAIYRRVLEQIRPHWLGLIGLLALSALAMPVALLTPLPLKIVVDSVIGSQALPKFLEPFVPSWVAPPNATLCLAGVLVVLLALIGWIQQLGTLIVREYLGEKIVLEFRSKLFGHVTRLSLAQHDRRGVGDLTYRIQYDAPAIKWLVLEGAIPFVAELLTLIAMLYVVARLNIGLGLVALIIVPVVFFLTQSYSRRLVKSWRRVKVAETTALSVVQEVIGAIRVVKAYCQERREQERLVDISRQGILERIRVILADSELSLLIGMLLAVGTAMVLLIGADAVRGGELTTGELVLVMAYIAQLYAPIQTMGKQVAAQQGSLVSAERTFLILDETPGVTDTPDAKALCHVKGEISFDDVGFSHDKERWALRNISFKVPAGSTVGIIGQTGAGKTTLVNLLSRLYDPTEGTIFLDGNDIKKYRITDLRNQFSIVLQEPVLFPVSIAENIAYGVPGVDDEAIIAAAEAAGAHDFIVKLPQGYDTLVGDRGVRLSGGERQRVSLARAFIKNSPLVILDEPTSSVDMATERMIVEATLRLITKRTTFIIAHRYSTLLHCDLLLVLEQGRLIQATCSPQTVLQQFVLDGMGAWMPRETGTPLEKDRAI
jgi:ATP-binding cassette subfamily B protein